MDKEKNLSVTLPFPVMDATKVFDDLEKYKQIAERLQKENDALRKQNDDYIQEIKKYCDNYQDLTQRTTNQETKILEQEKKIHDLELENKNLKEENLKLRKDLDDVKKENLKLQKTLNSVEDRLKILEENERKKTQLGAVFELGLQLESAIMERVTKDSNKKIYKFKHAKTSNQGIQSKFNEICTKYNFTPSDYEEILNDMKNSRLPLSHQFLDDPKAEDIKEYCKKYMPKHFKGVCEMVDVLSVIRKDQNQTKLYVYNFE
eukprot:gene1384-12004_t